MSTLRLVNLVKMVKMVKTVNFLPPNCSVATQRVSENSVEVGQSAQTQQMWLLFLKKNSLLAFIYIYLVRQNDYTLGSNKENIVVHHFFFLRILVLIPL